MGVEEHDKAFLLGVNVFCKKCFTYFGDKLGLLHFHIMGSPKSSDVCACLENMTSRQFLLEVGSHVSKKDCELLVDFPLARGYHAVTCRWVITSMLRPIMAACHG